MNIIGVQLNPRWENKAENFQQVRRMLAEEKIAPGSLIVLPEMFASGYSMNTEQIAERPRGITTEFLQQLATEHQARVLGGIATRFDSGNVYNEAVCCDAQSHEPMRYAKLFPFSIGGEHNHYTAGHEIVKFDCGGFRVAPFICYDLRFPEVFRLAARRGVELFIVIACWPTSREQVWETLLRARALENQAWVVGVNRCGADPEREYPGRSMVVSPRGEVVAQLAAEPGILRHTVDREVLLQFRRDFPVLRDMRAEFLPPDDDV